MLPEYIASGVGSGNRQRRCYTAPGGLPWASLIDLGPAGGLSRPGLPRRLKVEELADWQPSMLSACIADRPSQFERGAAWLFTVPYDPNSTAAVGGERGGPQRGDGGVLPQPLGSDRTRCGFGR